MSDEEQAPDPKLIQQIDQMSVEDLKDRISDLKAEIALCEAAILKKGDAKSAADAMLSFGSKD